MPSFLVLKHLRQINAYPSNNALFRSIYSNADFSSWKQTLLTLITVITILLYYIAITI